MDGRVILGGLHGRIKVGLHVGFQNQLMTHVIEKARLKSGGKSHPSRWGQ